MTRKSAKPQTRSGGASPNKAAEAELASKAALSGFDRDQWPFFWMTQAVGRYLQRIENALKRIDLDVSQWRALMCLHRDRPTSMTELADLAIVKLPTMTKVVQRMAAAGLVTSAPSPSDGRVTEVFLAPPGAVVRLKAWEIANHLYREAFADIDASAEHELNDLLKRVFRNLEPRA